jgi:hypothetical protein
MTAVRMVQVAFKADQDLTSFLFSRIEMASKQLVHCEHVDFVLLKHRVHSIVTSDLTPVTGILQVPLFDVCPYLLYCLRP